MTVQAAPELPQSCHWYEYPVTVGLQDPLSVERVCPWTVDPLTTGAAVFPGAAVGEGRAGSAGVVVVTGPVVPVLVVPVPVLVVPVPVLVVPVPVLVDPAVVEPDPVGGTGLGASADPVTYAEIGQLSHAGPALQEPGSALKLVCAEFSLRHDPFVRSRKYNTPPRPSTAIQYVVPDTTGTDLTATAFHPPAFRPDSDPDASNRPGCPPYPA
jgi:hypothetical protein